MRTHVIVILKVLHNKGPVAHKVEHLVCNREAGGSIPPGSKHVLSCESLSIFQRHLNTENSHTALYFSTSISTPGLLGERQRVNMQIYFDVAMTLRVADIERFVCNYDQIATDSPNGLLVCPPSHRCKVTVQALTAAASAMTCLYSLRVDQHSAQWQVDLQSET